MILKIQTPAFVRFQKMGNPSVPIGLFDTLIFEKTDRRQIALVWKKGFRFPTNAENPIYKIAAKLHRLVPGKIGVRIAIQKNIPHQKGLGSWISASIGTMLALNKLWNLDLSEKKLLEMAKKSDPLSAKILKMHFKSLGQPKSNPRHWVIVAIPKLIEIDRIWAGEKASLGKADPSLVAKTHFPDLAMIERALGSAGWKTVGMCGMGPAIAGFSEKGIGIAKIPKAIRSKLDFVWVGKACNGDFKLLD